jgi:ATP-binding cassette subfamily F protein uup
MDKLVEHLFIFEGNGAVYDFPGNYSDYRVSQKQQEIEKRRSEDPPRPKTTVNPVKEAANSVKRKLSFKENKELDQLTLEIEDLERERKALETLLGTGNLETNDLIAKSQRIADIISLVDQKTDRWIELSE